MENLWFPVDFPFFVNPLKCGCNGNFRRGSGLGPGFEGSEAVQRGAEGLAIFWGQVDWPLLTIMNH